MSAAPTAGRSVTPAPGFVLPGLHGETQTLDALRARGLPVLLLFTDPGSSGCIELRPAVARWQRAHAAQLTIAVLERGRTGADGHGRTNVLVDDGGEVAGLYGAQETPTAVLVGADGTIAGPVAVGGKRIEGLVARAADDGEQPRQPAGPPARPTPASRLRRRELVVGAIGAWPALGALLAPAAAAGRLMRPRPCDRNRDCRGRRICIRGRCDFPECDVERDCPGGKPCVQGICVECYRDDGCERFTERCEETGQGFECKCKSQYPERCEGRCTDTTRDGNHCGGCGKSCRAGEICVGGECVGGDSGLCPGGCDDQSICCQDPNDPARARCIYVGSSAVHCGACNRPCPPGWGCCGGHCRDTQSDPANCRECGHRCASGQVCYDRRCRDACPGGLKQCQGRCVSIGWDAENCGGCGTSCTGPFDTGECCNGTCCDINGDTCCGSAGCKNLALDSENCGGCGIVCTSHDPDIHCYCRFGTCTCEGR